MTVRTSEEVEVKLNEVEFEVELELVEVIP